MKKLIYAIAVLAAAAAPNIATAQTNCRTTCQQVGQFEYCNTRCY